MSNSVEYIKDRKAEVKVKTVALFISFTQRLLYITTIIISKLCPAQSTLLSTTPACLPLIGHYGSPRTRTKQLEVSARLSMSKVAPAKVFPTNSKGTTTCPGLLGQSRSYSSVGLMQGTLSTLLGMVPLPQTLPR